MKPSDEKDNHNDSMNPATECPICGRPVAECDSCALGLGEQFALHDMLTDLADDLSSDRADFCIARTITACDSLYPLAQSQWEARRSFTRTFIARIAAAVAVLLTFAALFFIAYERPSAVRDFSLANVTAEEMVAGIEKAYDAKVLISPSANKDIWLERASISVHNCDADRALKAVAYAFDLALEKWDNTYVLRDRELSLMENGKVRHVKMDLSITHEPDQVAKIDNIGSHMLSVDGPRFSAQVAQAVKIPLPYDQSTDVKLMTRKDETYAIARTFPWFVVTPDMKLEFMALTDEDVERFEAIRAALRGDEFESPISTESLGPLTSPVPAYNGNTIGEVMQSIADALGVDLVIGSGAELGLPIPPELSTAESVGDAFHQLCRSRAFYFTWHHKAKMIIVDERANLQQYLDILACNIPEGKDAAMLQFEMSTAAPDFFPPASSRTGDSVAQLMDMVLIRNHVWPLHKISEIFELVGPTTPRK